MSIEILQKMTKIFNVLTIFFSCIVSCVFVRWRIWKIFEDLTGIRKRRELQAISKIGIEKEGISQEILGMNFMQEEKPGTLTYAEDTGIQETEFMGED